MPETEVTIEVKLDRPCKEEETEDTDTQGEIDTQVPQGEVATS